MSESSTTLRSHLETVERYYALVSAFETDPAAFADLLHPEIEQIEYPNAVTPRLKTHGLAEMLQGAAAGKALLARQHFGITRSHACGQTLIVEGSWEAEIGTARGPFQPGQHLRAWLCVVFEFEDGLIRRQRNYDCYEPWGMG